MKKAWKHTILCLIVYSMPAAILCQVPELKKYPVPDEYLGTRFQCFIQNSRGFIYAGTSTGLFTFDGLEFTPVKIPGSDSIVPSVTSLFEARDGTVWAGFKNGRVGFIKNNEFSFTAWPEGEPASPVNYITETADSTIWFATGGEGIYYLKNNRLLNINADDGLSDNYIYTLCLLGNNRIAAGSDGGLDIFSVNNGKKNIESYNSVNGLPDNIVRVIKKQNDEWLWLGMQDKGICRFNLDTKKFDTRMGTGWTYGQVNDIVFLQFETWIATQKDGIIKYDSSFTHAGFREDAKLMSLYKDNEGNIWLLGGSELCISPGEQLQLIIPFDESVANNVHAVLPDTKGNIWITQKNTLVCFRHAGTGLFKPKTFRVPAMKENAEITSLYEDHFGTIWIGTMGSGMYVLNPQTGDIRNVVEDKLLMNGSILSISGRENDIWISSLEGVIRCKLTGRNKEISQAYSFSNMSDISGIGSRYVYDIFTDSKNRVWFATDGSGISVLENGSFRQYNEKYGIASKVIYTVTEDKKGNIWFSTLNAGIYCFNGTEFRNISVAGGLNDLNISSLLTDNTGNIISVHKNGLSIIDADKLSVSFMPVSNPSSVFLNTDLNSCGNDGKRLFLSCNYGILAYTSPVYKSIYSPQTIIKNISAFLVNVDTAASRSFPFIKNNLSFSFIGLYYSNPEEVQYQYKLEGYNENWVFTKDHFVNFPKLPPGSYTFKVRSSLSRNFAAASQAAYSFTIEKPFWQEAGFIISALTAIVIALFLIINDREKRLKKWERLEKEKIQAQYETLKSQVNPHFLFNSFNTLINIIDENPKLAAEYVEHLGDFYRQIVNFREKELVPLQEEIKIINHYFFIQKKRYGESLKFKYALSEEELKSFFIPALTLQLLAENAVKHNAVSKESPLLFEIYIENDVFLVAKNNINIKRHSEPGEGLGLQNILNRFRLLVNKDVIIKKERYYFTVFLPLIKQVS